MNRLYNVGTFLVFLTFLSCKQNLDQKDPIKEKKMTDSLGLEQSKPWTPVVGYDFGEKAFEINNLNLEKTSKNHMDLVNALGKKPDSVIEQGAEDFEEIGYKFYHCYYGEDYLELSQAYNSNADTYFVFGFDIQNKSLNVNGIKVGDSLNKVKAEFPKHIIDKDAVIVYLGDNTLAFYYINKIVTQIQYSSSI